MSVRLRVRVRARVRVRFTMRVRLRIRAVVTRLQFNHFGPELTVRLIFVCFEFQYFLTFGPE